MNMLTITDGVFRDQTRAAILISGPVHQPTHLKGIRADGGEYGVVVGEMPPSISLTPSKISSRWADAGFAAIGALAASGIGKALGL